MAAAITDPTIAVGSRPAAARSCHVDHGRAIAGADRRHRLLPRGPERERQPQRAEDAEFPAAFTARMAARRLRVSLRAPSGPAAGSIWAVVIRVAAKDWGPSRRTVL